MSHGISKAERKQKVIEAAKKAEELKKSSEPQLTEVNPATGLTAEQLQVAQELGKPENVIQPAPEATKPERHPDRLRKSTVVSPTKLVWEISDILERDLGRKPSMKEVLEEGTRVGIAFYTIRTQYGLWRKAKKADAEQAARNAQKVG